MAGMRLASGPTINSAKDNPIATSLCTDRDARHLRRWGWSFVRRSMAAQVGDADGQADRQDNNRGRRDQL
jgi:hypothetical protein